MPAVRCPETLLWRGNGDYRVEKNTCLLNDAGKFLVMRFREVTLKWGRFNTVERQNCDHQRSSSKGITPRSNDDTLFFLDAGDHLPDFRRPSVQSTVDSLQPLGFGLRFSRCAFARNGGF